ncbi:unnamed protein product [Caretta caretta]
MCVGKTERCWPQQQSASPGAALPRCAPPLCGCLCSSTSRTPPPSNAHVLAHTPAVRALQMALPCRGLCLAFRGTCHDQAASLGAQQGLLAGRQSKALGKENAERRRISPTPGSKRQTEQQ